jgi:vacuolar-type H+-ATPase subunit I/STV1
MTWTPSNDEQAVEVNLSKIEDMVKDMPEDMNKQMNEGGVMMEENQEKLTELNSKIEALTAQVAELNNAVVEANKALEAKNAEVSGMTEELNSLKAFKEEKDLEAKKAEINSYFETEIKKNGFTEVELNSLKTDYVDKMDLKGLKEAESDLCVKKVKELNSIQKTLETNSKDNTDLFMAIHNTEKSDEDISDLF